MTFLPQAVPRPGLEWSRNVFEDVAPAGEQDLVRARLEAEGGVREGTLVVPPDRRDADGVAHRPTRA